MKKLTRRQVHQICRRVKKNFRTETYRKIAEDYGVNVSTIRSIKQGMTYRYISQRYFDEEFMQLKKRKLTCSQVDDISILAEETDGVEYVYPYRCIAETVGASVDQVSKIMNMKIYCDC